MRNTPRLGPYRRTIPRVIGCFRGEGQFLMNEAPLYGRAAMQAELINGQMFTKWSNIWREMGL